MLSSLRRPRPPTFAPTPPRPHPVGDALVRDRVVTLDARSSERWVRFDFSRAAPVPGAAGSGWDLAARRFHIIVNGGPDFPGEGGARSLGEVPFDSVRRAPARGYRVTRTGPDGEASNPALEDWYSYDFFSHVLSPRPRTYAVRTADGRYAKVEVVSYYCPGTEAGCVTLRYTYQGDGSRRLLPRDGAPSRAEARRRGSGPAAAGGRAGAVSGRKSPGRRASP